MWETLQVVLIYSFILGAHLPAHLSRLFHHLRSFADLSFRIRLPLHPDRLFDLDVHERTWLRIGPGPPGHGGGSVCHLLSHLQGDHHEIRGPGGDHPDRSPPGIHHRGTGDQLPVPHPGRGLHQHHPHRRKHRDRNGGHLQSAVGGGGRGRAPDRALHPVLPQDPDRPGDPGAFPGYLQQPAHRNPRWKPSTPSRCF